MIEKFDQFGIRIELHWPVGLVETWMVDLFEDGYEGDLTELTRSLMETISPDDHQLRVIRETWQLVEQHIGAHRATGWVEVKCGGYDRSALPALLDCLSQPIISSWDPADLEEYGNADDIEHSARDFLIRQNPMAEKRQVSLRDRQAHGSGPPWSFEYRLWKPGRPRHESLDFNVVVCDPLGILKHWTLLTP